MSIPNKTIEKTMITGFLFAKFWDRWATNGLQPSTLNDMRSRLFMLEDWIHFLLRDAAEYEEQAVSELNQALLVQAELSYHRAGVHYNLIQWMFPMTGVEKQKWYAASQARHRLADSLTKDKVVYAQFEVDGGCCYGRIREPIETKGCVIVINPIDSSKEESYYGEDYFARMGLVTVTFDGPGQGETYIRNEHKASFARWSLFMMTLIDYTVKSYPDLELFLFGVSSGAAWAIQGSQHPKVLRTVGVSPVCDTQTLMPDYVMERLSYIGLEKEEQLTPSIDSFKSASPVFLIHGDKDNIVHTESIHKLYQRLPEGKRLTIYEDEGHCCLYRKEEILQEAVGWFLKEE